MGQMPAFRLRDHVAGALGGELLPYHRMHGLLLGPLGGAAAWSPPRPVAGPLSASGGGGARDIGQLADVAAGRGFAR
jgi:hypothetical protein